MYAVVVIDIPDLKHKGFTYQIPEELIDRVEQGSRVLVPVGPRLTQGFVIELISESNVKGIKPIKECLDLIPSLNKELIDLGLWMSEYYSSHLYKSFQMLIPSALKTKVKDSIFVGEIEGMVLTAEEDQIIDWVSKHEPIKQQELLERFLKYNKLIKAMIQTGTLVQKKVFKDKVNSKKMSFVQVKMPFENLDQEINKLSKQALKQKLILEYLIANQLKEIELAYLLTEIGGSRASVQALEKKGLLAIVEREVKRDPFKNREFEDKRVILNNRQEEVLEQIIHSFKETEQRPFLIHGVTGSGKTEIYLHAIEYVLSKGKDSIVLVPEIALTPQMVDRFKGRFDDLVAVLHSRLSHGERLDEWRRIQQGQAKIVIGARSAIFAPFKNLGLIIIDEEHESSYKQEEHPKYHVRDIASWRMSYNQAVLVLGSATPSMESYYKAINNDYRLLEMPSRIAGSTMPTVHIVDMREELQKGNRSMFSQELQRKIEDRLEKREQIILFLNRRGYSTFVMCRTCGNVLQCPHCEISLTYHHSRKHLKCHYCGFEQHEPKTCPECESKHIRYFGTGTQKVEEELARRFPGVRVIRMDVDTTSKKGAHEKLLQSFRKEEADILLGTQMIAKGLDFPKVSLVGIIAADTVLKLPDFRSAERTFQLLTQVSGRAGRHQIAGDVVVQTYTPEHYSIQKASQHDYLSFFSQELEHRKMLDYPPLKRIILIHFSHTEMNQIMRASEGFVRELKRRLPDYMDILGPVAAPISRIKDRYRFQCMIKYNNEQFVIQQVQQVMSYIQDKYKDKQLLISIDLDPYVLM